MMNVSGPDIQALARQLAKVDAQMAKVDTQIATMATAVSDMASSIKQLSEAQIRREEREVRQADVNRNLSKRIDDMDGRVDVVEKFCRTIELKRAMEGPAMQALVKWWPFIAVAAGAVGILSSEYIKTLVVGVGG